MLESGLEPVASKPEINVIALGFAPNSTVKSAGSIWGL
jgi:hypothetical protein